MLKKVEKNKKYKSPKPENLNTSFPNSKKIYLQSQRFKNINVPMREISLSDNEIKKLTVYDTSGCYSDPNIHNNYQSGLNKLREEWICNRDGIEKTQKQNLKFLNASKNVERFPNLNNLIYKKNKKRSLNFSTLETIL